MKLLEKFKPKRYFAEELVVRFLALYDGLDSYKGNMNNFLNNHYEERMFLNTFSEADFKKKCIQSANKAYVVADSSKFDGTGLFGYANWDGVTGLITDNNAPENQLKALRNSTEVIIAE